LGNNGPRRVAVLCNPSPRWNADEAFRQIENFPGFEKTLFKVDRGVPDSCETRLSEILAGEYDALAVMGGDGSLNRTVNFLASRNTLDRFTLAVLPFGTCNDFAKSIGLPPGAVAPALEAIERGRVRDIRIGQVNRHFFLNNAGFGRRAPERAARGALAAIRAMQPSHLRLREPRELQGDFYMMICANAPYFSNGLHFEPGSNPGDDTLDFYFVRAQSKWKLLWRLAGGRKGKPLYLGEDDPMTLKVSSGRLALDSDDPLWIMTDGEIVPDLSAVREAVFSVAGRCRFIAA
jgi:diacylglycerol kinase family enzyme